jgi:hypothetical protein
MNYFNNTHHLLITPVGIAACEQEGPSIPLAPLPSASATSIIPDETLSSGPSFPCLGIGPSSLLDIPMSEGAQTDGSSHRGRSRNTREQKVLRSLTPPTIIRLRPRFARHTPRNDNSTAVVVNVIVSSSSSSEPSTKSRVINENPALAGDIQLKRRSSLLDGQVNMSSFPRAA